MVTDHNEIDDNEYIPGMNCGHLLLWSLANQGALPMWTKSVLFDIQYTIICYLQVYSREITNKPSHEVLILILIGDV